MSPVVREDGAIHHPTRLSVGPAWLTAAIYLNVIGSKLARERVVRKEGTKEGWGSPWGFLRGQSRAPDLGGRREAVPCEVWGAVHGAEPHLPPSLSLRTMGMEMGEAGELSVTLGVRGGLGASSSGETPWKGRWREETVVDPRGYGHAIWNHGPGVFIHLKGISSSRTVPHDVVPADVNQIITQPQVKLSTPATSRVALGSYLISPCLGACSVNAGQ